MYLLPQSAFPTGGLYFKNKTWVKQTKGKHVIIHNNYITGFEKKIKRFRDHGLWLVDEHSDESPLGRIWACYQGWSTALLAAASQFCNRYLTLEASIYLTKRWIMSGSPHKMQQSKIKYICRRYYLSISCFGCMSSACRGILYHEAVMIIFSIVFVLTENGVFEGSKILGCGRTDPWLVHWLIHLLYSIEFVSLYRQCWK